MSAAQRTGVRWRLTDAGHAALGKPTPADEHPGTVRIRADRPAVFVLTPAGHAELARHRATR